MPYRPFRFGVQIARFRPTSAWREQTNPDAWHAQHWQKRRADLIDICGAYPETA